MPAGEAGVLRGARDELAVLRQQRGRHVLASGICVAPQAVQQEIGNAWRVRHVQRGVAVEVLLRNGPGAVLHEQGDHLLGRLAAAARVVQRRVARVVHRAGGGGVVLDDLGHHVGRGADVRGEVQQGLALPVRLHRAIRVLLQQRRDVRQRQLVHQCQVNWEHAVAVAFRCRLWIRRQHPVPGHHSRLARGREVQQVAAVCLRGGCGERLQAQQLVDRLRWCRTRQRQAHRHEALRVSNQCCVRVHCQQLLDHRARHQRLRRQGNVRRAVAFLPEAECAWRQAPHFCNALLHKHMQWRVAVGILCARCSAVLLQQQLHHLRRGPLHIDSMVQREAALAIHKRCGVRVVPIQGQHRGFGLPGKVGHDSRIQVHQAASGARGVQRGGHRGGQRGTDRKRRRLRRHGAVDSLNASRGEGGLSNRRERR